MSINVTVVGSTGVTTSIASSDQIVVAVGGTLANTPLTALQVTAGANITVTTTSGVFTIIGRDVPVQSVNGITGTPSIVAGSGVTVSTAGSSITIEAASGGGSSLPPQGGNATRLLATDGTAASWATRYSVVDAVLAAGAGISFAKDTSAGSITIEAAGGTSGVTVGSATPQPLGVAGAGTASSASREDHVHAMPTAAAIGAASAVHTHVMANITDLAFPVSVVNGKTGTVVLTSTDVSAASASHTHVAASITNLTSVANVVSVNGQTGVAVLNSTNVSAASAVHSHVAANITDFTSVANVVSVNGQTGVVTITGGVTAASVTTKALAVDQNNYDAGSSDIVRLTPSANVTLTGLAGGSDGVLRVLYNVGTHVVTLATGNTNSAATNRFSIVSGNVTLDFGDSASAWYDGTSQRWRVLEDQIAGGGSSGVASIDGLTGSLSIVAGSNVTVTTAASSITIAAASGSGSGSGGGIAMSYLFG